MCAQQWTCIKYKAGSLLFNHLPIPMLKHPSLIILNGFYLNHEVIELYYTLLSHLLFTAPSSPLQFSLSPLPGSPYQLFAFWSQPLTKNGIITAYTVYCNTSASQAYPEQMNGPNVATVRSVLSGTTLVATISGFIAYTKYECYVAANTSVGGGNYSNVATARTDEAGEIIIIIIKAVCQITPILQPKLLFSMICTYSELIMGNDLPLNLINQNMCRVTEFNHINLLED